MATSLLPSPRKPPTSSTAPDPSSHVHEEIVDRADFLLIRAIDRAAEILCDEEGVPRLLRDVEGTRRRPTWALAQSAGRRRGGALLGWKPERARLRERRPDHGHNTQPKEHNEPSGSWHGGPSMAMPRWFSHAKRQDLALS